jgi:ankyrin repeat protein
MIGLVLVHYFFMFLNRHQFEEVNMSKKRVETPNPLLGDLLEGIFQYQEKQSSEALELIGNAIDKGANALHNLSFGQTPFSLAVRYGLSEVVELMIAKNIDPQKANSLGVLKLPEGQEDGYSATPLHVAVRHKQLQVVETLLKNMGCGFKSNNKFSPLHLAIANQDIKTVTKLIQGGCDPNAPDYMMGKTAYQWAQDYGGEDLSNFNFDVTKE